MENEIHGSARPCPTSAANQNAAFRLDTPTSVPRWRHIKGRPGALATQCSYAELEGFGHPDCQARYRQHTGNARLGEWQAPTQDLEMRRRLDQITAGHSTGMNLRQEMDLHRLNNIDVESFIVHKYLMILGSRMGPIPGTVSAHELLSRSLAWDPIRTRGADKTSLWPLIEHISAVVPCLTTESRNRTVQLLRALLNLIKGQTLLAGIHWHDYIAIALA
jgi:hypothetical protein